MGIRWGLTLPTLLPVVLLAAAACTSSIPGGPTTVAPPPAPSSPATSPTIFNDEGLLAHGWVRDDGRSTADRKEYVNGTCLVQTLVVAASLAADDDRATEVALGALAGSLGPLEDRADVQLPVDGGTLALRARRATVDAGAGGVMPLQVAVRVLNERRVTIAVTHGCYDRTVSDSDFDAIVALLALPGVSPAGL